MKKHIYKSKSFIPAIIALLFWVVNLNAEVYTLKPGGGSGENGASGVKTKLNSVLNLANSSELFSRELSVNGNNYQLKFLRFDLPATELIAYLKNSLNVRFLNGGDAFFAEIMRPDGQRERLLLLSILPNNGGTFAFYAVLPKKIKESISWPTELPKPANATAVKVIRMADSETLYGQFKYSGDPAEQLRAMSWDLASRGYTQVTPEAGMPEGRGEIFLRAKPYSMILINFDANGVGSVVNRTKSPENQ